jgi:hypothetical protein
MRIPYSFSVLRYIHDSVTQEFVNIGVAVYSQQAGFLRAICTTHYSRVSQTFTKIDGNRFRELTRYIQAEINKVGESLAGELPFESDRSIEQLVKRVLPPDDSSIQFSSPAGVGLSADLTKTLQDLFNRYVERYTSRPEVPTRNEDDVWRVFREPLEKRHVTERLTAKRIVASCYDYEFQRAWKNEVWHLYEPVSFDLVHAGSLLDKANQWVGRATSLIDSSDRFKMHMLLGGPQDEHLVGAFEKAQNILNKMPGKPEFIRESEADAFAEQLASEISTHDDEDS